MPKKELKINVWIDQKTGEIVGADPKAYLEAYSHFGEGEEPKTYFKMKGTQLMKLLESLSKVPRKHHHCGGINCDLILRGMTYPEKKGEKFKYRVYYFALIRIVEDGKIVLETDYKRFGEYLQRS